MPYAPITIPKGASFIAQEKAANSNGLAAFSANGQFNTGNIY
jgi:hypothetical protein